MRHVAVPRGQPQPRLARTVDGGRESREDAPAKRGKGVGRGGGQHACMLCVQPWPSTGIRCPASHPQTCIAIHGHPWPHAALRCST
eukprot:358642-Chlamydomonas_euryale.AAC.2